MFTIYYVKGGCWELQRHPLNCQTAEEAVRKAIEYSDKGMWPHGVKDQNNNIIFESWAKDTVLNEVFKE